MIFYGKVCKNNPNRNRIEETMNPLKEKLAESLVIFDGAIGTEIYRRNFFINASSF